VAINNDVDINEILLEVLNSKSSFGDEMRNKISSTLDVATKSIEKGIGAFKFSTTPITIMDIIGGSENDKKASAGELKTQQNKIITQIKKIAIASNFKKLKDNLEISDLFASDKIQKDRIKKQYLALQKKILKAIETNIPTKVDIIPEVAKVEEEKQPPEKQKEETNDIADANMEQKLPPPLPKLPPELPKEQSENIKSTKESNTLLSHILDKFDQFALDNDYNLLSVLNSINDNGDILSSSNKLLGESNTLLGSIAESLNDFMFTTEEDPKDKGKKKKTKDAEETDGSKKGREPFQNKLLKVMVVEFDDKAVSQLVKAVPGMDKKKAKDMEPKQKMETGGFVKGLLKYAGITALMGLLVYLKKNPEKLEDAKKFFIEKFLPFLGKIVKEVPKILEAIGEFIYNIPGWFIKAGEKIGEWAFIISDWVATNFNKLTDYLADKMLKIKDGFGTFVSWIDDKVWEPIKKGFSATKKTILGIPDFIKENVWTPLKNAFTSVKDTLMGIPTFVKDMFLKIKQTVIDMLNEIPGISIGPEAKIAKLDEKIAKAEKSIETADNTKTIIKTLTRIQELKGERQEIIAANSTPIAPEANSDFIYRPGQPIQKVSKDDVLIGAKEKIVVENKNMDKQMHDLTVIMEAIKNKFDDLLLLNSKMLNKNIQNRGLAPLPAIPSDIGGYRGTAFDEAYKHKTKVWELLHGVA